MEREKRGGGGGLDFERDRDVIFSGREIADNARERELERDLIFRGKEIADNERERES